MNSASGTLLATTQQLQTFPLNLFIVVPLLQRRPCCAPTHAHRESIPIALLANCAILTPHVVKEIPFSVDQVGQMLLQAALFHAQGEWVVL